METTLLTKENAHRVTMVRRVDAPESEPVAFLFRGKRYGYCSYSHLVGNPGGEEILAPANFKDWEVVEVAHPGYLEEYFRWACDSYNLTSFSPEERGETDIASHEKELHEDLQSMPEQQRERYMENYKRYFSAMIAANSRCASAMITGPARFNTARNERPATATTRALRHLESGANVPSKRYAKPSKPPSPKNSVPKRNGRGSKLTSTTRPPPSVALIRAHHAVIAAPFSSAILPDGSPHMPTMAMSK